MPVLFMKTKYEQLATHMHRYEIANHEPLHDITGMIAAVLEELPSQIPDKKLSSEVATFRSDHLVSKHQVKGSDARKLLVRV